MTILFDWFKTPGTNVEGKRTLHALEQGGQIDEQRDDSSTRLVPAPGCFGTPT